MINQTTQGRPISDARRQSSLFVSCVPLLAMALFLGFGYGVYHIRIEVLLIGSALRGELFAPAFKKRNLAAKNLSRTTEDSRTVIVPLIPWYGRCLLAGTPGVPTLHYAQWTLMCYLGIIFALIFAFTGFAIAPTIRDDETIPGS